MRLMIAIVTALACALPRPAFAQDHDDSARSITKVIVGAGALAIGVAVAAKSSQTTTVSTSAGTSETSTFSKSQLVTGLAVAGVGGILLWDGLRTHEPHRASTLIGAGVGPHARLVFIRRLW